jgi:phage terminase large subunit-like protein
MYLYAKKICDNPNINENFLSIIYGAADDDDWESEEVWEKCNPSLGTTITLEYLREEYNKTKEFSSYINSFRLFYLNQFVDNESAWLDSGTWLAGGDDNLNISDFENEPCWLGVDLSSTNDLSVIVTVFEREQELYVFPKIFVPYNSLETKERVHKVPYRDWENGGHITATTGNEGLVVDYSAMTAHIDELAEHHDIQSMYIDPWSSAAFINMLKTEYMDKLVMTRQGYATMSPLTTETEKLIIAGKLHHPNNPCLNWNVENVVLEIDPAGNVKPSKKKSVSKIDGAVAMVMAVGGAYAELNLDGGEADVLFL